ncbi:MAG TPA: radical SAM protein [bacterium]|nr:radical SAM protein [bacterium]
MTDILYLPLSNVCNLRCIMCGSQHMEETVAPKFLDEDLWLTILDRVPGEYGIGINSLGEHTLHPRFLAMIEDLALQQRFIKISTNGMWRWPNEKRLEFVRLMSGRRNVLLFSVDGGTAETVESIRRGVDFHHVLDNVRSCIELSAAFGGRPRVVIAYCLMRSNLEEMRLLMEQLPGLSGLYVNLLNVNRPALFAQSLYDERETTMRFIEEAVAFGNEHQIEVSGRMIDQAPITLGCNFPHDPWMDLDGNVYPCCRRYDVALGNIGQDDWATIISRTDRFQLDHPICQTCLRPQEEWSWENHFASEGLFAQYEQWRSHHDSQE